MCQKYDEFFGPDAARVVKMLGVLSHDYVLGLKVQSSWEKVGKVFFFTKERMV